MKKLTAIFLCFIVGACGKTIMHNADDIVLLVKCRGGTDTTLAGEWHIYASTTAPISDTFYVMDSNGVFILSENKLK